MSVIFYAAGPDIGHHRLGIVRNIDIAPTILDLLSLPPADPLASQLAERFRGEECLAHAVADKPGRGAANMPSPCSRSQASGTRQAVRYSPYCLISLFFSTRKV